MSARLDDLERLRTVLWESIEFADPEKRASLAGQLRAVVTEIESLSGESGKAADPVDEIAARRAARGVRSARERVSEGRKG